MKQHAVEFLILRRDMNALFAELASERVGLARSGTNRTKQTNSSLYINNINTRLNVG